MEQYNYFICYLVVNLKFLESSRSATQTYKYSYKETSYKIEMNTPTPARQYPPNFTTLLLIFGSATPDFEFKILVRSTQKRRIRY